MSRSPNEEKDIEQALGQNQGEEGELERRDEPRQYLEVPKPQWQRRKPSRTSSERSVHHDLEKVTSAADTVGTNASDYTEATEITTTPSRPLQPEHRPWHHRINPLRNNPPPVPKERIVSREYNANILSLLTFQWINPFMTTGYKRTVEENDIWLVNPDRGSEVMMERLMTSFKKRAARNEKRPLIWAVYDTVRTDFLIGGTCAFFSAMFQVFSPFTTRYLIQFATEAYIAQQNGTPGPGIGGGLGLAFGITFMQICQSTATNHFIYRGMMSGGEARAVLINAIFEKTLKISGRAKAGGKALADEGVSNGIDEPAEDKGERPALKRFVSNKLHPKTGPKMTGDVGKGVFGDGSGWNNGKIVGLMSVDTYRVDQAAGLGHMLWTAPIQVCVVLVVLCINIGYSALAGYALIVICMPLLTKAIKSLFVRRKKINSITDKRVTLTQEILGAVRFVKFFGWESSFLARLKDIRKREIRAIQVLLSIRNAINAVSMSMPVFASMLAFIVYSVTGHNVSSASRIFSSLALFNSLRMPLNLLPLVIGQVTDAAASLGRIQEFLLSEEQSDEIDWDDNMEDGVQVLGSSFTWERNATQENDNAGPPNKKQMKMNKKAAKQKAKDRKSLQKLGQAGSSGSFSDTGSDETAVEPFKLSNIDFTVGKNELIAVIGSVGSGKTSLLAALAGDMRRTGGKIRMSGSRAFCPQYAWIQNATLKENVLFGKPYKTKWYNEVIDACALRPDLSILPAGDQTEIGERGITLSGGQKQRLNIARAIYFDADIVLMDDPLSAVDAHVGRHIMDEAICGIMKDKCRILATHQLHVLSRCDRIIWMEDGHIQAIDTFDRLMADSVDFRKLMETTSQEDDVQKKGDGEEDEEEVVEADVTKKEDKRTKSKKKAVALMQAEERAVKSVSWDVWGAYIGASGSWFMWPLIFLALIASQGANIATSLWLSYWVSDKFGQPRGFYIGIYAMLGALQAILMFTFATLLSTCGTTSSKVMLQKALESVLRAPMPFFDTTPLGRITNRFSKDVDSMDNNLTDAMRMYFLTLAMIISVFCLIIAFFHYFGIALAPLLIIFLFASSYYRASARELKRHEALLRSVVFARFSESVSGVASIRAYGLQSYFRERVRDAVDQMDSAYFLTFANQRWLSTRLDMIGNLLVLTVGLLVVTNNFNVNPSIAGLVLSYILAIVQMIQFTVRQLAEVENNMNATERIHYYGSQLEQEAPLKLKEVLDSWPQSGAITFDNVEMRYRAELPLVLQGLSFQIRGGERVGIVGRTGAGKSSIMSALFRLTELSGGQIKIDDVNIAEVGLQDLRSRLAIIPQDPTLFRGTIRSNLDPFNEHSDLALWDALRKADLVGETQEVNEKTTPATPTTPTTPNTDRGQRIHLDSPVEEEGLNFSLGQRQLMALARALVRNAQIIVCDEATSSVDFETDEKIQRTMRLGFAGKTVLCIAHRLKTIINYDRICVMDQGQIAELDTPINLFERGGIFRGMCDKSHIVRDDFFRDS
ncbi:ATP-binding cassette transporter yor1 [Knufia fluminis]|uniref:ATP-binding cassette transporter yor1 n=1 Tax=Knufia fluminis TaxID=191047 RepID=A0AAN8ENH4_9EURO|nr:ATP-binding cassette transporter yor1 [Knufia fluminis]